MPDQSLSLRRRYRSVDGLRSTYDPTPPQQEDFRIDKAEVRLTGVIRASSQESLLDYRRHVLSGGDATGIDFFGPADRDRRYRIPARARSLSLSGSLLLNEISENRIGVNIHLRINPTRTLAHAWATAGEAWGELSPFEFFRLRADATMPRGLDGKDNFLQLVQGPYEPVRRLNNERWAAGWELYQQNLLALIAGVFLPRELRDEDALQPNQCRIGNGLIEVSIPTERLSLSSVEAYFERYAFDAPSFVRTLAPLAKQAARSVQDRSYFTGLTLADGTVEESPALKIPQRDEVNLTVYSKTRHSVRYEFRITHDLSRVFPAPAVGPNRLGRYAASAIEYATDRASEPFGAISSLMASSLHDEHPATRVARLADSLRLACISAEKEEHYRSVLEVLLVHREVTARFLEELTGDSRLLGSMEKAGIVQHYRFRRYEAAAGRSYALNAEYQLSDDFPA